MNIENMNPDRWPNAATLMGWSRILKASYVTVCKYHKLGVLKGKRQVDRSIIVPKSEIIRWLALHSK